MLVATHENPLAAYDADVRDVEFQKPHINGNESISVLFNNVGNQKFPHDWLESGPDVAQGDRIFLPEELRCRFDQIECSLDPVGVGVRQ